MGAAASLLAIGPSSECAYRYGQSTGSTGKSSTSDQNALLWVGQTLEMPPKPFSLETYFLFHAVVGTGMLGKVRLVQHKKSSKFYALKSMPKRDILVNKLLPHVEAEKKALIDMTKFDNPFTVKYFGSLQTRGHVHFLLEYVPGGELFHRLQQVGKFTIDEAKFYATELLVFIENCHKIGYMYRDLKPENVLLDGSGHLKVVDFGFVKKINTPNDRTSTCVGTPQYLAPEQLTQSSRSYTRVVDWWAFACVVFEMVNGHPPFAWANHESAFALYTRILKGQLSWSSQHRIPSVLRDFLKKMLIPDINKRLCEVEQIKNHDWFEHVDWQDVRQCEVDPPYEPKLGKEGDHAHFDAYPNSTEETMVSNDTFVHEFRHF